MNRRFELFKDEIFTHKSGLVAIIFLIVIILLSTFAFLSPYEPDAINIDLLATGPSLAHPFGTDSYGRDILTRALYGGRISLLVAFLSVATSSVIGIAVGTVAGYYGGFIDNLLMRIVDIFFSIPWLIAVTVLSIILPSSSGILSIVVVIGLFNWMKTARLVRAETLSIKESEYVLYAQASGQRKNKIIIKHILPGIIPTFIVSATMSIASAIITESTLSFLGLGVGEPMSSWGSMLQEAQENLLTAPYMAILPGLFIIFTVLSFNKIGDVVRVVLDPKTQSVR